MLSIFTMAADVNVHNVLCYADAVANKLLSSGESKIFPLSSGLLGHFPTSGNRLLCNGHCATTPWFKKDFG